MTTDSIAALAAHASSALDLVVRDVPVDEPIISGLDDGIALCETILLGVQAETSDKFSARSIEAQKIVRCLRKLPNGARRIAVAGKMMGALRDVKRGVQIDDLTVVRDYFHDYCEQIPVMFGHPMGCG